ncbi:hypothetical protein J31TS3_07480 [Paenibacillus lactis]|nr:hypothetical protein J31TS3_07480 [Paenibacillus lactis]
MEKHHRLYETKRKFRGELAGNLRFVLYGGTDLDYCRLDINGYEISN